MSEQLRIPAPAEYARWDATQRGTLCAAMSMRELADFARDYAAYLTQLCGQHVPPSAVVQSMIATAVDWRQAQRGSR